MHQPAPGAPATPSSDEVVEVPCDAVARGTSVPFTGYDLPRSCAASGRAQDHVVERASPALRVIADPSRYRQDLGCESTGIDFARERIAVYSYVRNSADLYRLSDVRLLDGALVIGFDVEHRCQGIRQQAHRGDRFVRIPRGSEPVRVALCRQETRCGGLAP